MDSDALNVCAAWHVRRVEAVVKLDPGLLFTLRALYEASAEAQLRAYALCLEIHGVSDEQRLAAVEIASHIAEEKIETMIAGCEVALQRQGKRLQ